MALNFKATINSDYYYIANSVVPQNFVYLHIFNETSGSHTITRKRSTSFSSDISSLQVDTSSIAWMGVRSVSSSYSELIKYDRGNDNYTIYQITGSSFSFQYIYGSSSDNWYAIANTQYSYFSTLTTINDISGLSIIELQNSGFDQDSTLTITGSSGTLSQVSKSLTFQTINEGSLSLDITCGSDSNSTNCNSTNSSSSCNNTDSSNKSSGF